MFPIGDDNSDRTITPYVNYLIIALNVVVFVFLQGMSGDNLFTYSYATVPAEILTGHDIVTSAKVLTDPTTGEHITVPGLGPTPIPVYLTLITSMFMHGGIAHIAGNMLYLWIFGDNIENAIGHKRYLFFYLLCGIIASLSHVFVTKLVGQDLRVPSLGASGAISGVLGAYILLFPRRRVTMFLVRFITHVSAFWAIGIWIVFQLISGLGMLGGASTGVAYAAHIGGFVAGLVLIKFFLPSKT
ncbi:MAG TPA: rhomboid family intramembrane serine protease [Chitinophagaceae bacterium]|nr:rhomboid family intramembrane serine protease [Chitinophagaceae bacterium]